MFAKLFYLLNRFNFAANSNICGCCECRAPSPPYDNQSTPRIRQEACPSKKTLERFKLEERPKARGREAHETVTVVNNFALFKYPFCVNCLFRSSRFELDQSKPCSSFRLFLKVSSFHPFQILTF